MFFCYSLKEADVSHTGRSEPQEKPVNTRRGESAPKPLVD